MAPFSGLNSTASILQSHSRRQFNITTKSPGFPGIDLIDLTMKPSHTFEPGTPGLVIDKHVSVSRDSEFKLKMKKTKHEGICILQEHLTTDPSLLLFHSTRFGYKPPCNTIPQIVVESELFFTFPIVSLRDLIKSID